MNKGIFKLVFSQALNMFVPASEIAKSRTCKSAGRKARKMGQSAHASLLGAVTLASAFTAYADGPAGIIPQNAAQWIGANIANINANTFTVQQNAAKAYLDFTKFNLLKGETYQQLMAKTDSALLRIHDTDPSRINGNIKASGNLFMINTNGIIFGGDSQINVGSLYASSLDIDKQLFLDGLFSKVNSLSFSGTTGFVMVEQGAKIFADTGGRVILMAPNVTNNGLISTPDGQTILAAGNKVYLQSLVNGDVANGGKFAGENQQNLIVEVDAGGTATNIGKIIADRGNVTLVGLAVNQQGVISASTSVRDNGSVKLLARDTVTLSTAATTQPLNPSRGGTVTLGKDSVTEVRVETDNKEEISKGQSDTSFTKSKVVISAAKVDIEGKIIAKGGDVTISNANGNGIVLGTVLTGDQRIYLGHDSLIDVSGVDAVAPMDRNQLEIQLYSSQLKDVPLLRDSTLYKQTVYVDGRKITAKGNVGTDITDVTPFLNLKGRTVAELMTEGGKVNLAGEVIQRNGSVVNVSGGTTTYLPGTIKESKFTVNGKSFLISEINADTPVPTLADIYIQKDSKWGVTRFWDLGGGSNIGWGSIYNSNNVPKTSVVGSQVASYKVGADAGEIANINSAPGAELSAFAVQDGTLLAQTYVGQSQRDANEVPLGGKIAQAGNFSAIGDVLADDFTFDSTLTPNDTRLFNVDFIKNGFNRINLIGQINTPITVTASHEHKAVLNNTTNAYESKLIKSEVVLNANVNANVIAHGSNIIINKAIADDVKVSSAGLFINDTRGITGALTQPVVIDAGDITLGNTDPTKNIRVAIGNNVSLDASAGAWQNSKGILQKGSAGNIAINLENLGTNTQLQAYGFDTGGTLGITTLQNINVAGIPNIGDLYFGADYFQHGGFSKYTINSSGDNVVIGNSGVVDIFTNMQTLRVNSGYMGIASGSEIALATSPFLAPDYLRKASSIEIDNSQASTNGHLLLNENATIRTDAGGSVTLNTTKQLTILGDIITPAGVIKVSASGSPSQSIPYDAKNGIFIGEHANLNAAGVYRALPSNSGLVKSAVLNAGKIDISSKLGPVVLKQGAVLDVSAASGITDTKFVDGYHRGTLYGDAGAIAISARDGLALDADFKANAAGTGRGGSLSLSANSSQLTEEVIYPKAGVDFIVTQNKTLVAQGINAGGDLLPATSLEAQILALKGKAQISVAQVTKAGFDNLAINNNFGEGITFDAGVNLVVPGALTLQANKISVAGNNGTVTLNSSYFNSLASESNQVVVNPSLTQSNNNLTVNADQINIEKASINNVNITKLNARLDITSSAVNGGLITAPGEIDLTARNIYPATAKKLSVEALGSGSKIIVNNTGLTAKPVLSAQGELTLSAENIEQNGSLKAPFGNINLVGIKDAIGAYTRAKNISLGAGSVTSVSSEGQVIPFSVTTLSGQAYQTDEYSSSVDTTSPKLADKAVYIKSDNINQKVGAKVDLSGGGDMFAYEFISGAGGTVDILKQPDYYAVLPSIGKDYAPVDSVYQASSASVKAGDAVYLTGVGGLATGTYTLLPARYALVAGAFLVKANVKSALLPNQTAKQLDGSTITTGYRETLGTDAHDATWSSFNVVSGALFRPAAGTTSHAPAEYKVTSANDYFAAKTIDDGIARRLPQDAGQLTLDATKQLVLDGDVIANKAAQARGALVDITSEKIRIVANTDAGTDALQLKADTLNKLGAESVLIGGTRTIDNGQTTVTTNAKTVSVESGANVVVPELIASATESINVQNGAAISTGVAASKTGVTNLTASGDGALLAVSSINDINYSRTGSTAAQGALNIEAGAKINAGKSLVVDATQVTTLKGTLKVADGGSATLGANRILLGNPSPAIVGLNVNNTILSDLGNLGKLTLNSNKNIDIYGAINFGNQDLDLTVNSGGIAGHMATGESAEFTASKFTVKNTVGSTYEAPTTNNGQLNITAANVALEGKETTDANVKNGITTVGGFAELNVTANNLRAAKTGSTKLDIANTNISTGLISAESGADYKLSSSANITTTKLTTPIASIVNNDTSVGIGAKLAIEANNLNVGSTVDLAAGNLTLTSKLGDLNLNADANISAKSALVTFYDKTVATLAGIVSLVSNTGNVNVNSGAVIDVSSSNGANAGTVKVTAAGLGKTANIAGILKGTSSADNNSKTGKGATLAIDVDKLASLTETNTHAIGFSDSRQYRVRNDNVAITGTGANALAAREVKVDADYGSITVTGDINATSEKNSHIELNAKNDLVIASTANLNANSTQAGAKGGTVKLATTVGRLDLQAGSNIQVSGGQGAENTGAVYLRAPRTADNTDINIRHVNSTITGAQKIQAEGFKVYDQDSLTETNLDVSGDYYADAANFMASVHSAGFGLDRIASNNALFNIVPGIEVQNTTGDLELPANSSATGYSFNNWRYDPETGSAVSNTDSGLSDNNQPLLGGVFTLRANGNINLHDTLSDGFATADLSDAQATGLNSWAFNLVAGSDTTAANTQTTIKSTTVAGVANTGNLALDAGKGIRTGTGDINIATGGDLVMGDASSVIYTAGHQDTENLTWFVAPATGVPQYLIGGGDINLQVQNSIVGQEPLNKRQVISDWLFRAGGGVISARQKIVRDTTWWVRPDLFKQSLATFGGGNVNINAGGNVSNFSASAATNARYDSVGNTGNLKINGGGDVTVNAGGDINNGIYFVAKGQGNLNAGGSIQKLGDTFGTTLALQNGQFNVTATKNTYIEAVINPTLIKQPLSSIVRTTDLTGLKSFFNTYGEKAAISIASLTGTAEYGDADAVNAKRPDRQDRFTPFDDADAIRLAVARVNVAAFNGDVNVQSLQLLPAADGNVNLLAKNNVSIGTLEMSDADPALLPQPFKPVNIVTSIPSIDGHSGTLLHANDQIPAMIVAQNGSITGLNANSGVSAILSLPKAAKIVAGQDISALNATIQNNHPNDVTLVKALHDIKDNSTIAVAGPGELLVEAGRNLDLGSGAGINSFGNSGDSSNKIAGNPALAKEAASITIEAGLGKEGATLDAYLAQYIAPTGSGPLTLQGNAARMAEYRTNTTNAVTAYVRKIKADNSLTDTQALAAFNSLSTEAKTIFAYRHLSSELLASGEAFAQTQNNIRGDDAIAALFAKTSNHGDITLFKSLISTKGGGSIDLLAPNGLINVGLAGGVDAPGDKGIITQQGGAIRAFADTGFEVNTSKVITQFGSDITVWVNNGDIDAGRGSKTATSIPKRIVSTDKDGNTTIENIGVAAGSGIRAQTYDPDGPNGPLIAPNKGKVALIAPRGKLDAGEAGIEAGDFLAVATQVIGADNISVSGASQGVPAAAAAGVSGASAGLSPDATNSATQDVARSVAQAVSQPIIKPSLPSLISVEVLGIGE